MFSVCCELLNQRVSNICGAASTLGAIYGFDGHFYGGDVVGYDIVVGKRRCWEVNEDAPKTPVTWKSQIIKPLLVFVAPLAVMALLTNVVAVMFPKQPWVIMTVLFGGIPFAIAFPMFQLNKLGQELHGKSVFALTCRERPGDVWADYGVIKSIMPVHEENKLRTYLKKNMKLPVDSYIPYEIVFERWEFGDRMRKMLLLSPCPIRRLTLPMKADIIYKSLPIGASVSPLDVVVVAIADMAQEKITVVIPTGSDWHAEAAQKLAKMFAMDKADIDVAVDEYDGWRSVELQQKLITREKDLQATLGALADADKRASEASAAAIEDYLLTEDVERELPAWLRMKKFWLIVGAVGLIIVGLWLGGILFG